MIDLEYIKALVAIMESSNLKSLVIESKDSEKIALQREEGGAYPSSGNQTKIEMPFEASRFSVVTSPMVGLVYLAKSPDAPPFVREGDRVESGTILCVIESMKVINEVKADKRGVVKKIFIQNGDSIEFGDKLFMID